MTVEEAKKKHEVMMAFANGSDFISYNGIKYRPFSTQEECWDEMLKHQPFGFVRVLEDNTFSSITGISKDFVCVLRCSDSYLPFFSFKQSFQMLTFMDGTPFGIKEE